MTRQTASETIFFIDRNNRTGLQSQLRESIVSSVLAGRLPPSMHLPSTRKLATYLNISRITVTLAYSELAAQGYLEAVDRSGYRVARKPPTSLTAPSPFVSHQKKIDWNTRLARSFIVAKPMRKPLDWRRYPFPFLYGQMDTSLFDLAAWRDCARRALARDDFELMAGDFAAADDMQLIDYIRSRTLPSRGIHAAPDEILVTVGAQNALWIVTQLLLRPGGRAACENPCHPDIGATLRLSGASVFMLDVDSDGLQPAHVPRSVDAIFVTPSHHSPTGVTMPLDRRLRLLAAAARDDFIIVEDDYEFEMSYIEPPSPALKAFDRSERVFYIGSFSKSLFPGLRLGYLVAPAPVIHEARALRALMLRHPPGHLQRTAAYFLALGHHDAALQRMRTEYHRRHVEMADALDREGLKVAGSRAFRGTSFWIEGPAGLDADLLMMNLRDQGVLIESGSPFFGDSDGPCPFFRMGYSSISRQQIAEGVRLTKKGMDRLL
ncbi:PLP-dependent aminotransferase family protein [Tianweitania sp. BSSL-BM11]|uniref:PLP-dependent aminotransferase family protein n=1 Tax=Tianweitania aestuarii TaxID=2814886 RepID=A0ABS5RVY7_9HYPH|nr:PLP-dependent aminotransferase family protein [Tianweitania aestuarii]MBS9721213.1 PLP-dependent aminotransferase family protein [Tianweitania aestuarii]